MRAGELLEKLRDGIKDDETLEAWCLEHCNQRHTVFLGFKWLDPPGKNYFPVVVIGAVENIEVGHNYRIRKIRIAVNLEEGDITDETVTPWQVTHEGFPLAEDFREEVEDAVFRLSRELGKITINGQTIEESYFDNFASETSITIEQRRSTRRPAPAN